MKPERLEELKKLCEAPPGRIMAESRTALPELIEYCEKLQEENDHLKDRIANLEYTEHES